MAKKKAKTKKKAAKKLAKARAAKKRAKKPTAKKTAKHRPKKAGKKRTKRSAKKHPASTVGFRKRMNRLRKHKFFSVITGKKKFKIIRSNPIGAAMNVFEKITGLRPAEAGFIFTSGAIIELLDGFLTAALTSLAPSVATTYASMPGSEAILPIILSIAAQKYSKNQHVHDAAEGLMAGCLVNLGQDLVALLTPATTPAAGFGRIVEGARGQTGFGRMVQGPRGQSGFGKISQKARKSSFKGADTILDDGSQLYVSNPNDYDNSQTSAMSCSSSDSSSGSTDSGSEDSTGNSLS